MIQAVTEAVSVITARCEQRTYGPYDDFHGTPHAMLWRKVTIETPGGRAAFEQTDYGHPGRLNPWEPRGVAVSLVPRLDQLKSIAESMGRLYG